MKISTLAGISAIVFTQGFAVPAVAIGDSGCVTAKCHAAMGTAAFVHGPVGAQICTVCHNPVPGKDHEFQFAAEKETLCFGCHEDKRDMMLEDHRHTPVAQGNCVGCHDPHQSEYRYTLKAEESELCFVCHDRVAFTKGFVHGPVAVGDCNVCHDPHASANVHQLKSPPEQLCFTCHEEQENIPNRRHAHKPVSDGCVTCHSPHSNVAEFQLASDPPGLCFGCHTDISEHLNLAHQHEPVATGQCKKCHDVHGSESPALFLRPQAELCLSCHSEVAENLADNQVKHGPVKDGDCNACHDPHGSANFRILRKYFPSEFYMPYAEENYALCFGCHNRNIALDAKTATLTDFRDKEKNLHYLHVNKEVKGRSCKACHAEHASVQPKHIRQSVPFGNMNWDLPVTYSKLEDGGKCVVGCHAPQEYHR